MDLTGFLFSIILTGIMGFALSLFIHVFDDLLLKPQRLRSKLRNQGLSGPPRAFLFGNAREIHLKREPSAASILNAEETQLITHNYYSNLYPSFAKWREQYGPIFMFSLGNKQLLFVHNLESVKEICRCTTLDLGKPSDQQKEMRALLGQGIISSNGAIWAHQRKILAPEFHIKKVKGMTSIMVESANTLLNLWNERIKRDGGVADIKIDEYMRNFSGDVISRACFGSSYGKGEEIFSKLRALQRATVSGLVAFNIPGMRYLPTKNNRELWRLEREVRALILKVVKERQGTTSEKDLLQVILEAAAANRELGRETMDRFIVDNCKNICLAGFGTVATTAAWTLMLLAQNPEWQSRVRAEVVEVCGTRTPDADMLCKMKKLTMVIYESLRLYPPVSIMAREALQDMELGNIQIPKGVAIWIPIISLHQDPEIWGPNSDRFDPERFANGVIGACAVPHVYMPFGAGSRVCLGQNFAMAELKVLIALIVSNFSLSVSPRYCHAPAKVLAIEPKYGVDLLVKKL